MTDTKHHMRFPLFSGLGRTLFISLLLFSLLPLSIGGLLSYRKGHTSLLNKEVKSLEAAVNLRTFYLQSYFQERIDDLILQADFSGNIILLQKLHATYKSSGLPLNQFIQTYKYASIVTEHGDDIQEFQELSDNFHDILFIDIEGNILHSVAAELNLATNIFTGHYRDTELARVSRKTMALGQTLCSDLTIHESSGQQESLYATQVMVNEEGDMIGIMVMQIRMKQINRIMADASGLGDTGQIFLVGNDRTLRSHLRQTREGSVLSTKINSPLITPWQSREDLRHHTVGGHKGPPMVVLSPPVFYQGQNNKPVLALSRDVDILGIYDLHWMLIAEIDEAEAFASSRAFGRLTLAILAITAVLVCFMAAFLTRRMINPLTTLTRWARKVSQGDLTQQVLKPQKNEIGTLYLAMTEMVNSLQKMMHHKDQQDWFKSGEAGLSKAMQGMEGMEDISVLGKNILTYICKYLDIQAGAFFLFEQKALHLSASYDYQTKENQTFALGEGLIGQAALEKKPLHFTEIPDDHFNKEINSGLGQSIPQSIYALPLLQDNQLLGVLEFGATRDISDQEIQFLKNISSIVAITIKTALTGQKVKRLLEEKTKRQGYELDKRQEELEASNKALQTKATDLELASKYKSEFLANMSHELRSPLNSLLILAQSLADNDEGNLTPEQVEEAQIIHSGGRDLLHLINDILDLSKVEAGHIDIHLTQMSIADLIKDIKNQFQPLAKEKDLTFTIRCAVDLPPVIITDKQRLKQILTNLLANSIKFTNQGTVDLSIQPAPEATHFNRPELKGAKTIAFRVSDSGIGIPEEKQRHVFKAFQQGDGSISREFGGTGLGLTISLQLSQLMGGELQLSSKKGDGSVFTLYLPLDKQSTLQSHRTETFDQSPLSPVLLTPQTSIKSDHAPLFDSIPRNHETESAPEPTVHFNDQKILIVDNDMRNTFALAGILQKVGLQVDLATNGKQALEKIIGSHNIDLILMNAMMPEMDGYEATRRIRELETDKDLPLIILTAKAMPKDRQRAFDAGANDYLTKPIDTKKLFSTIRYWLN